MATTTTRYDVAEHLRNEEEMRLYIEAAFEEAGDDAAFIDKALGDVARALGMTQVAAMRAFLAKACTRRYPASEAPTSRPCSR